MDRVARIAYIIVSMCISLSFENDRGVDHSADVPNAVYYIQFNTFKLEGSQA